MKKCLILFLVALFCVVSSNAFADAFLGSYSISVTITPPSGGAAWDGMNPAELEVGTTYSVAMDVLYDSAGTNEDLYYSDIQSTIAFNNSGTPPFVASGYADNIVYNSVPNPLFNPLFPIGPPTFEVVESAEYHLLHSIPVTEAMLADTKANSSFQRYSYLNETWVDIRGTTETLPTNVNVTASTPEPTAMLLLGTGFLGLLGVLRRKRKA